MKRGLLCLVLIFSSLVLSTKVLKAQQLQFSLSVYNFPDTASPNDSNNFTFILTNLTNTPFQGSVTLKYFVNDSSNMGIFGTGQTSALVPLDTFTISVNNFPFNPSTQFSIGDNVVVVWPSIDGSGSGEDSLYLPVYVPDPNGIESLHKKKQRLNLYPNPVNDVLNISLEGNNLPFEELRIYDMKGRLVLTKSASNQINVEPIPNGIYLIEAIAGEQRIYQKFFKD